MAAMTDKDYREFTRLVTVYGIQTVLLELTRRLKDYAREQNRFKPVHLLVRRAYIVASGGIGKIGA